MQLYFGEVQRSVRYAEQAQTEKKEFQSLGIEQQGAECTN